MQVTWSIFPKFQRQLDPRGLAGLIREVGLDTTNLVVRDGYWVTPANLERDTARFVREMAGQGVEIRFATTSYTARQLIDDPTPLKVFANHGIRAFRIGYFDYKPPQDVRAAMGEANELLRRLAGLCEQHAVRAIYQLHHNTLVASPSAAAVLLEGVPPAAVGLELDPGNQTHEGHENYQRTVDLLRPHIAWAVCKDSILVQDKSRLDAPDKGWRRRWAPAQEGVVRWDHFFAALASIDFNGVLKLMPFYDENDPAAQRATLGREVAYLKRTLMGVSR